MSRTPKATPWWRRPVVITPVLIVLLCGAMVQQTTFVGPEGFSSEQAGSSTDEAVALARDGYESTVLPAVTEDPVPLVDVVAAAQEDPEAAGEELGTHEVDGKPYSYAVTATGTVAEGEFGEVALEVDGLPEGITVGVAVPPYGSSTALRDVGLEVQYGDFENQIAYQAVAFELNSLAAEDAFDGAEADDLLGKQVTVVGAITWASSTGGDVTHLQILPVRIEEQG